MGWEHEPGTVWRAQELYCLDHLSFDRVSELTGVATSTLKRWADKYRWRERRDELAQVESEIRFNTVAHRGIKIERVATHPKIFRDVLLLFREPSVIHEL